MPKWRQVNRTWRPWARWNSIYRKRCRVSRDNDGTARNRLPPQWKLGNGHGPSIAMAKGRMKGNPTRHPSLRYSRIHLNSYRAPRTGAIVDAEHVAAPRASARGHG